jgi:hypothetical protein
VQTLTRTSVFPVYAAADRAIAAALAEFLERGADVEVLLGEGEIRPGEDLISKARDARTADVVLVLFSRNSMPSRWARAQWESALVTEPREENVPIAFVRCDDCVPPAVLNPRFELAGLRRAGLRDIKRWVRRRHATWTPPAEPRDLDHAGYLEDLGIAIADRAGTSVTPAPALAYEFARAYADDFDEICHLQCGDRSIAALAGDLASQLGLRLEGEVDDNLERLTAFCSTRRFLFIIEDASQMAAQALTFEGRCSTLMVEEPGPPVYDELRSIQYALSHPEPDADWSDLCRLARTGRRLTRDAGRLAECFELMQQWNELAHERDDRAVLDESAREMVWILEGWERPEEARQLEVRRAAACDEQLPLFF